MSVYEATAILNFQVEDHEGKLMRKLYQQTSDGQFHDITLTAHGISVHAHRAILCANSEYFQTLFSGRWSNTSSINLSHLAWSTEAMQALVRFMYTGKVEITKDNVEEILNTATHLLMGDLRGACAKYLLANLAPKNCISIWKLGDMYHLTEVERMCQAVAASRFQDYLLRKNELLELDHAFLKKVIRSGLFDGVAKDEILTFLSEWQKYQNLEGLYPELCELVSSLPNVCGIKENISSEEESNVSESQTKTKPTHMILANEKLSTEVIITYMITNKQNGKWQYPLTFDVYMYLTQQNTWKLVNRFEDPKWDFLLEANLIGFVDGDAVYDGGLKHRSALVDYKSKLFRTLSFPNKSALSRRMFCFDDRLFLIEDTQDTERHVHHKIYALDMPSLDWTFIFKFELSELFPGVETSSSVFSYTVVCQTDQALIWIQDRSSYCRGPFWMSFQKDLTKGYSLKALERQPLTKEDLRLHTQMSMRGWKHAAFKVTANNKKVFVHRQQTICNRVLSFDILLTYDIADNTWTRNNNLTIEIPNEELPIKSRLHTGGQDQSYIQFGGSCNVQSLDHGCFYVIEEACPFVTRMWSGHLEKGQWSMLTPPPVENMTNLRNFSVVSMPDSVAEHIGISPGYEGAPDDAPHSPLLHWDLSLKEVSSDIEMQSEFLFQLQQRQGVL